MTRPVIAQIHGDNLRHNLQRVRSLAPQSRLLACVKADGYGHGILHVARTLRGHCDGFAVACLEEALVLRKAGIDEPVVLLEGVFDEAEWLTAATQGLTVCIGESAQIDWLARSAAPAPLRCWLKVDTGMHRLGISPQALPQALARLNADPRVQHPVVLATHFACADDLSQAHTHAQLTRFRGCTDGLSLPRSSANSAAILGLPESHFDWVRPGYMLYGGSPLAGQSAADCGLRAAMSFQSAVISLRSVAAGESVGYGGRWVASRDSRIATIAAGYGDGYPRSAGDGTPVLVNGQRGRLAGRVSMDMLTVDVTDLAEVTVGAQVQLWGEQLPVDEIAAAAGTIGYELLAGMPPRVPRRMSD